LISHKAIVVVSRSYQNQFVTSVNYHTYVILAKTKPHVGRYKN